VSARPRNGVAALTLACALGILLLACTPPPAAGLSPGPASILGRYAHTYNARVPEMLDGFLAADYETVIVKPPQVMFMDRATVIESVTNMLEDEETTKVTITFEPGYNVVEDDTKGVWRIENLRSTLRLEFAEGSSKGVPEYEMTTCSTLYVCESTTGEATFEILREVIFEGVGCEDE